MKNAICIILLFLFAGCIEPYHIEIENNDKILVVEGIISSGTTKITLCKTVGINYPLYGGNFPAVNAATMYVECEDGTLSPVASSSGNGIYMIETGELNIDAKYRLVILENGDEYHSGYITPAISPPVNVTFDADDSNIHVCVSTHGYDNQPGYYLWSYTEDWEITSYVFGDWAMVDGVLVPNDIWSPQNRYYCWKTDSSKVLILGTTEKLTDNDIIEQRIHNFSRLDDRSSFLYRIKVKQHTIHKEAYDYFFNQQKNIEQTGSIFGVIPSEITGNIRCVSNPDIPVIGYVDVSTTSAGSQYLNSQFYDQMYRITNSVNCIANELINPESIPNSYILYTIEQNELYHYINRGCVDCTLMGGLKKRPKDWENNHY